MRSQVRNTQTLNGRQEVEYFCQISFRLKLLQPFPPPPPPPRALLKLIVPAVHHGALGSDICLLGLRLQLRQLRSRPAETDAWKSLAISQTQHMKRRFGDFSWAMEQLSTDIPALIRHIRSFVCLFLQLERGFLRSRAANYH